METFTVRDLGRKTASVLAASKADGVAVIQSREGEVYELRRVSAARAADAGKRRVADAVDRHLAWMAAMREKFPGLPVSAKRARRVDELVSGDRSL